MVGGPAAWAHTRSAAEQHEGHGQDGGCGGCARRELQPDGAGALRHVGGMWAAQQRARGNAPQQRALSLEVRRCLRARPLTHACARLAKQTTNSRSSAPTRLSGAAAALGLAVGAGLQGLNSVHLADPLPHVALDTVLGTRALEWL